MLLIQAFLKNLYLKPKKSQKIQKANLKLIQLLIIQIGIAINITNSKNPLKRLIKIDFEQLHHITPSTHTH